MVSSCSQENAQVGEEAAVHAAGVMAAWTKGVNGSFVQNGRG